MKRPDGSEWELGSGGFGKVYKALRNGVQPVAVKMLSVSWRLLFTLAIAVHACVQATDGSCELHHHNMCHCTTADPALKKKMKMKMSTPWPAAWSVG